jgi:hypothetical protein
MDIDQIQEANAVNGLLRAWYSKVGKTEPACTSNYITHYHKCVMEPERERHLFFESHKDPHLNHGLYLAENAHVEHLPKELKEHH